MLVIATEDARNDSASVKEIVNKLYAVSAEPPVVCVADPTAHSNDRECLSVTEQALVKSWYHLAVVAQYFHLKASLDGMEYYLFTQLAQLEEIYLRRNNSICQAESLAIQTELIEDPVKKGVLYLAHPDKKGFDEKTQAARRETARTIAVSPASIRADGDRYNNLQWFRKKVQEEVASCGFQSRLSSCSWLTDFAMAAFPPAPAMMSVRCCVTTCQPTHST